MSENTITGEKSYIVTLLLAFFLGFLGAHRFYTGYWKIGLAQIVLSFFGIGFIWVWVDTVSISLNKYQDASGKDLVDSNSGCGLMVLIFLGLSLLSIILTSIKAVIF